MAKRIYKKLERIDEFIPRLAKLSRSDTDRIWGLCSAELRHLKSDLWMPAGASEPQSGYRLRTLRSVLTNYRAAVRQQLGTTHPALEFLRPSNDDQHLYQGQYHRDLKSEQRERRPIVAEELVDTALAILENLEKVPRGLVIDALELLTGRRGWELANVGAFSRARRRPDILRRAGKHVLYFEGQAKTKDSPKARTAYHIPVLADPDLILHAFAQLHELHPMLRRIRRNRDYNRNEGKRAAAICRRFFFDARMPQRQSLTPKDLRECYAAITFAWYAPDETTIDIWIADHLGHSDEDVTTSQAYKGFYLAGQKAAFERDIRASALERIDAFTRKRRAARSDDRKIQLDNKIRLFKALFSKT